MRNVHIGAKKKMHVPRGASILTLIIIGVLLSILSDKLTVGPRWTILFAIAILLVPMEISVVRGNHDRTRILSLSLAGVVTAGLITSVAFLIHALFHHSASAASLFRSACLLWIINIGVFAVWYWEMDRGGPLKRHSGKGEAPDFLFPQMTFDIKEIEEWTPVFLDYFYLAYNTNTAFSPTDTLVLSKKAKIFMMVQSSISLLIVAVVAARAVNIA